MDPSKIAYEKDVSILKLDVFFSKEILLFFEGFIFVIGLVGNGIVIAVVTTLRRRAQNSSKSSVQLFLLHLAISDLMVCLLSIPLTFFTNFHYPTEYHTRDSSLCKLKRFMQVQYTQYTAFAVIKWVDMQ